MLAGLPEGEGTDDYCTNIFNINTRVLPLGHQGETRNISCCIILKLAGQMKHGTVRRESWLNLLFAG